MNMPGAGGARQAIQPLALTTIDEVYAAYMPFVKHGGLFLKTTKRYSLGDPVFLVVTLPSSTERHAVACHVCWYTPARAQESRVEGIGLQFDDTNEAAMLRGQIETLLAGRETESATCTM